MRINLKAKTNNLLNIKKKNLQNQLEIFIHILQI